MLTTLFLVLDLVVGLLVMWAGTCILNRYIASTKPPAVRMTHERRAILIDIETRQRTIL